ncbi:hypothetical protein [Bacillus sp. MRMR6]|uniref:hypothetical protein n=1 Tax=Bacillus sp. MRMR6 TaxID=1928617 RepID=UPI000952CBFC|nr:hypothetical protein [Bacillus sp. MRMR6]OLS33723.1 hypothetical protein BTR25_24505 [Bacillus sp. MRMR6]
MNNLGKWEQCLLLKQDQNTVIGGIYRKVGTIETYENGIVNSYRGAQVKTIDEVLTLDLAMMS